jgi:hypothetical protein
LPVLPRTEVTRERFVRLMLPFAMAQAAGAVSPNGEYKVSAADSARILSGLRSRITASTDQLANLLPRYTDLRCDEKGTMWMQPFDIGTGGLDGGPTWLRIAPDGTAERVRLPDRFDPYRFTSRRIWGVQRSELDIASVAWIVVP